MPAKVPLLPLDQQISGRRVYGVVPRLGSLARLSGVVAMAQTPPSAKTHFDDSQKWFALGTAAYVGPKQGRAAKVLTTTL
jgi:hypothetical protein